MPKNIYCSRSFLFVSLLFLITSCSPSKCTLEPEICFTPTVHYVKELPNPFPPLTSEEFRQIWGKELAVASGFANEMDFYRAITAYKRALFLLPPKYPERKKQIQYGIIESYYFGKKYQEALDVFETSDLVGASEEFPALNDLLVILYDCYYNIGQMEKAQQIMQVIEARNPEAADKLELSKAIEEGDLQALRIEAVDDTEAGNFFFTYEQSAKSVKKARFLNAILPGAGYLYVGQKQTALTSFCINALFTAAAYYFYDQGNIAAGVITTSLEMGWYFGGINGAGLAAKEYNEHIYNALGKEYMLQQKLFPVLMIQYGF